MRVVARSLGTLVVPLVLTLAPAVSRAQPPADVVAGTVVAERSERPLTGVQIAVDGQPGKGAVTDASGRFRIAGVTGTQVTVTARMLGFRPATQTVTVGTTTVRFALAERALELNQVVVTGTAGGQQKRAIGNSIASVNAADVVATAPVPTVQDLLNGRTPGVVVMPGTGMVGSGSKIRIRGLNSFSLSGDPLVYVDGVRVNNQTGSGLWVQAWSSGVVSRMNDFDPEEIESIEVLKGPSAATLYGTEAANGVINIITKKGASGGTRYAFTVKQGSNWFQDDEHRVPTNYWKDPSGVIQSINVIETERARGTPVFRTGLLQDYDANVSGGNQVVHYFASAGSNGAQGAEPNNERRQFSGRTNLQITPTEKVDVSTSLGYVQSHTTLSCEAGCGGATWGGWFSTPANLAKNCAPDADVGCGWARGFNSSPPEADRAMQDWQDINRLTGSVTLRYKPLKWLENRFAVGTDFTHEKNEELLPYLTNDTLRYFWGQNADGWKYQNRAENIYNTYDYNGTAKFDVSRALNSATSFGLQYYTKHVSWITGEGDFFPAPGLETISSAAKKPVTLDDFWDNTTLGYYGQQQFGWRDRLFVTAAVRVDNNSSFGKQIKWVTYPKASVSWVLHEEPFFRRRVPEFVNNLRVRAAYGQSGQQPDLFTALRTFRPVPGHGGEGALTPNAVGNPDLGPERGIETEGGFESSFFGDRIGLDFTYYNKRTKNAILARSVAPSSGFGASTQYVNAGEIQNHGLEALLKAAVVSRAHYGWDLSLNVSTNRAKVAHLKGTDTTIVNGSLQQRVGYAPWSWFRERVVSAQWDATGTKPTNVLCDDGKGGSTPCFNASGAVIAPRVYLGRAIPSVEGSITSGVRFLDRFRVNTMVDFKAGYKKYDNNLRIRCQIFRTCLENIEPEKYDPKVVAQMNTNGTLVDFVVRDAHYAKLREISLAYDAPEQVVRRFGAHGASLNVAARNLHVWTPYTGIDPENMFLSGTQNFIDQAELPQLTSFIVSLRLSY